MRRTSLTAAIAAFALVGGAVFGTAAPALADETAVPPEAAVVEAVAEGVAPPAPIEAAPVAEPAPAEPAAAAPAEAAPAEPTTSEPEAPPADDTAESPTVEADTETAASDEPATEAAADAVEDQAPATTVAAALTAAEFVGPQLAAAELLADPVKRIAFCHATGSDSNPYVSLETSVNAFFNAGHDTHQNFEDIVPPFSYVVQGETIDFPGLNWDAEGQAIFGNGCAEVVVIPGVATASVFFTAASCTAPEQLMLGTVTNATWGPITDPAGSDDYSVTAFANPGSFFDNDQTELTFMGELDPIDTSEACDNTEVKKVEFCHHTGSDDTNPYVLLETSVNAFFNAGHDTHQDFGDIVPPFSYIKQGDVIEFPGLNWDAEGQAFFAAGCEDDVVVEPEVATASVSFTPATCSAPELLVLGAVVNATWGPVTDPLGDDDYYVTATADDGAFFEGGLTELTFSGELDPMDMSEECDDTLVKKVSFCHATGSENNPYVLLETSVNAFFNAGHDTHQNFEDIVPPFSYVKQGEVIDFPGLNWDAEGQAFFENGCADEPPTVLPVIEFTQFTCDAVGTYTVGVAGDGDPSDVTFTVNGTPGVLSGTYDASVGSTEVTAQAVDPFVLDPAWVDPAAFEFAKPTNCGSPSGGGGLAMTGGGAATQLLGAIGALLFIGGVAMAVRRRESSIG